MTTDTAKELHAKICPECGELFHTDKPAKVFCGETCRVAYANLSLSRGKPVTPLLITWRRHRNSRDPQLRALANKALSEMCRLATMFIEEDKADKRDTAIQTAALLDPDCIRVKKTDRPNRKRRMSKATAAARPETRAAA